MLGAILTVARFFRTHFSGYTPTILLLAFLSFIASILEGIGINAVIPLFSFVNGGGGQTSDFISQSVQRVFEFLHVPYTLFYLFIMIGLLFAAKAVVLFITQYITLQTQVTYERDRRDELLRATLESDWTHLSAQKLGHLEQILIMSVEMGSKFLIHLSAIFLIAANLAVYGFLALNISIAITFLTLVFGAVVFWSFKPFFRRNRNASDVMLQEYRRLSHYVNENIIGLKTVKASAVEEPVIEKASGSFDILRNMRFRVGILSSITTGIMQPLPLFFIMGIFAFFYKTGSFSFAAFAIIVYAINKVFNNFQSLQSEMHTVVSLMPHLTTAREYLMAARAHREHTHGTKRFSFERALAFEKVGFAYDSGQDVLSDVSFTLRPGDMLGLIGPSGAGKTTLVDLFLRLLLPSSGSIRLDGADASEIDLREWRTNVGYVSQDSFFLNDTIANNIRFYNESLSDEEMMEAARLANIDEFIRQQPEGYETIIGERGIKLSGGQRQRIALARVLARHPRILILDEATSALDNESEILVQKSIEGLKGKVTVIAIAHRLSTIIDSDRLIVLEKGRIVEEGNPQELLADQESYFSKVYNLRK